MEILKYMAGIIDTEGCIRISKEGTELLSISMCDIEPIEVFQSYFGGNICKYEFTENENRSPIFQWKVVGEKLQQAKPLLPLLRLERKQQALQLCFHHWETKDESLIQQLQELPRKVSATDYPKLPFSDLMELFPYFAGVWDGDGCSTILKQREGFGETLPFLVLEMCDREVIDYFGSLLGGHIRKSGRKEQANHSPSFRWELQGRAVIPIAESLLQFMLIPRKRKALSCVLECAKLKSVRGRARHGVPFHILKQRQALRDMCLLLNQRGADKIDHSSIEIKTSNETQIWMKI